MSVSSINSNSTSQAQSSSSWQQIKQNLQALNTALKSGDLPTAKDAFAKLTQNRSISSSSPLGAIGQALQNGDVKSAAQVVYPAHVSADNKASTMVWQQLNTLVSSSQGATTANASTVNNKLATLLTFLSTGKTAATSSSASSSSSLSDAITQALAATNNSISPSSAVSLDASANSNGNAIYTAQGLAQQIKNNPQFGAQLLQSFKSQSVTTSLFDSL